MKIGTLIIVALAVIYSPFAASETTCTKWSQKRITLSNTKTSWDGEILTIRFYNNTGKHINERLKLSYTFNDRDFNFKVINELDNFNSITGRTNNSWDSASFSLPLKPYYWKLFYTQNVCENYREKSVLENLGFD